MRNQIQQIISVRLRRWSEINRALRLARHNIRQLGGCYQRQWTGNLNFSWIIVLRHHFSYQVFAREDGAVRQRDFRIKDTSVTTHFCDENSIWWVLYGCKVLLKMFDEETAGVGDYLCQWFTHFVGLTISAFMHFWLGKWAASKETFCTWVMMDCRDVVLFLLEWSEFYLPSYMHIILLKTHIPKK